MYWTGKHQAIIHLQMLTATSDSTLAQVLKLVLSLLNTCQTLNGRLQQPTCKEPNLLVQTTTLLGLIFSQSIQSKCIQAGTIGPNPPERQFNISISDSLIPMFLNANFQKYNSTVLSIQRYL